MKITSQQPTCRYCQTALIRNETWSEADVDRSDKICLKCKARRIKELRDRPFPWGKEGEKYNIKESKTYTPQIDVKKEDKDSQILGEMIRDTEKFRIDQMLKALGKTSDTAMQYEIIVYLLKAFDELSPRQAAKVINAANRLFKGKELLEKPTVRLAKVLRAFNGEKKSSAPQKFEQMLNEEGDQIIEI